LDILNISYSKAKNEKFPEGKGYFSNLDEIFESDQIIERYNYFYKIE